MRFTITAALFIALLSGCVAVPYEPQPTPGPATYPPAVYPTQPPPPRMSAYEEIRLCKTDNQRAHAEVLDSYERARRAGRIDPAEAQEFNAMDARLRNVAYQLGRDGLNLPECQYISGELARMRDAVHRMARYDQPAARCMADNRRAHGMVYGVYNDGVRAGRIDAREAQRFREVDERLKRFQAVIKRDGVSLDECQRVGRAIAQERAIVDSMIRN